MISERGEKTLIRLLSSIRKKYGLWIGAVNSGTVVYLTGKKISDIQMISFYVDKLAF